ncbi:MAG: transcriptional regulator, TetR family [Candidatus Binatus sp.]|jgi:AcrR family transcriptional regulator|nr:transcriptional regulator, TetR family [Candidatus Binatus sp.]
MERQARRAQVLRHAKRIFARKGYHHTNVADIISRARIARGTFYLYFQNKKDLFEELLEQVVSELTSRIQRLRVGPEQPDPVEQLRANLERVLSYVLAERDLTDILLNHSTGFDRELDEKIQDFYDRIAALIQRSLDLGIEMKLVRPSDTRVMAYCILGGIKETVGMLSRGGQSDITRLVEDILSFGLGGVAQPELLEVLRNTPAGSAKVESGGPAAKAVFFVGQN